MPTKPADVPRAAKPEVEVELEFRAAPVSDVAWQEPRVEPRAEPRLELRTETQPFGMNFEMQFDRAFRSAFTSVPLSLPIPRLPSTESFGFPLFDREVSLVATLDAPADASRRRNQMPRTRSAQGRTLPRAYVAHRAGSPPTGELVVRTLRAPLAKIAPEPTPPVVRVSTPTVRATVRPPEHMPLFSAFAASGVLSAATEGDTSLTRDTLRAGAELRAELRAEPAAMPVPVAERPVADRAVPLQRTVEAPVRRRSTPVARTRVVRPPRGLALIGHWLRRDALTSPGADHHRPHHDRARRRVRARLPPRARSRHGPGADANSPPDYAPGLARNAVPASLSACAAALNRAARSAISRVTSA